MKFRTYAGAQPGVSSIMQALAAPGSAYNDTMRDLAYVDSAQSAAAKNYASADLDKQQYAAREGIPGALANVPLPEGYTPDLVGRLFTGSANPSMGDFTGAMKDLGATPLQREAADAMRAGNVGQGNAIMSVLSGDAYMPFRQSDSGVIDQATGAHTYSPAHQALVRSRDADAAQSYADAEDSRASARARGFLEVSPGASIYDIASPVIAAMPGGAQQPGEAITGALPSVDPIGVATPGAGPQAIGAAQPGADMESLGRAEIPGSATMGALHSMPQGQPRLVATAPGKPGGTSVTVNNSQEGAFSKEVGKKMAQRYDEIESGAIQANNMNNRLDRLGALLEQVNTGRFAGGVLAIKQAARGLGIDLEALGVTDDVGPAEAAKALSNELALQLRNPAGGAGMPGAMSDKDREFLVSMVPGLMNTPEGRRTMIETSRKLNQRSVDVAKMARDYVAQNGQLDQGFFTALQMWSDENPLFEASSAYQHPEYGRITEEDIAETMRANNMTREQVMQQLGLQ